MRVRRGQGLGGWCGV